MFHSLETVFLRVSTGQTRGARLAVSGGTLCSSDVVDGFGWPHLIKKRDFRGDGKGNRRSGRRGDGRQGRGGGPKEQAPAQLESRLFDLISNPQKLTKKQEAVLQETGSTFIDTSRLPFLKYLMPEKEYHRFINGSCTTEERKRALRKYENVLPRRPHQMHMIQKNREFIDSYSLRRCMVPEVHKTPEEVIDSVKEKMCALYSIEESEFERYKEEALKIVYSRKDNAASEEEKQWEEILGKMKDDPTLSAKALSLQNNPNLSSKDKVEIATSMISCMS